MITKYRLYDKQEDAMYEVTSITWNGDNVRTVGANGRIYHFTEDGEGWPVMQATGIRDQHGNEIYEGDTLFGQEITTGDDIFPHFGVYWSPRGTWDCESYMLGDLNETCEIVGNIYQNPELVDK